MSLSAYLQKLIDEKKAIHRHLTLGRIAQKAGLHTSQLSKVLKGKVVLQPDHVYALAESLGLRRLETNCLEALNEFQRSSNPRRRERWSEKASELLSEVDKISSKVLAPKSEEKSMMRYFLEPKIMLLHLFLGTEDASRRLKDFQRALEIDEQSLENYLGELESLQLIERKDDAITVLSDHMHLDRDSPWCAAHQQLLRLQSLQKLSGRKSKSDTIFSATFTADEECFEAIRKDFQDFLKKAEARVLKAEKKRAYQVNFELFPWL
jgi:uncharacterized protein (TIGR02147 family)